MPEEPGVAMPTIWDGFVSGCVSDESSRNRERRTCEWIHNELLRRVQRENNGSNCADGGQKRWSRRDRVGYIAGRGPGGEGVDSSGLMLKEG